MTCSHIRWRELWSGVAECVGARLTPLTIVLRNVTGGRGVQCTLCNFIRTAATISVFNFDARDAAGGWVMLSVVFFFGRWAPADESRCCSLVVVVSALVAKGAINIFSEAPMSGLLVSCPLECRRNSLAICRGPRVVSGHHKSWIQGIR